MPKHNSEEVIVEMERAEDGTYHPIAIRKRPVNFSKPQKAPVYYQILDGFIDGLDVIERFFNVMNKYRGGKNV